MSTEQRIRAALIDLDAGVAAAVPAGAPAVRVVLVCDEPILLTALARELASSDLVDPCAATQDVQTVAELARQFEADVVFVVQHPLRRVQEIVRRLDGTPAVVFGHVEREADVAEVLDAGVAAVVSRQAPLEQVIDTLRVVRHPVQVRPAARTVLTMPDDHDHDHNHNHVRDRELPPDRADGAEPVQQRPIAADVALTARERQIVQLIVDDYSIKQIATRLGIALQTTKNHVHHVMVKVGATTRLQLYAWALAHGFVSSRPGAADAQFDTSTTP